VDPQWNLKVDPIGSYLMWEKGTALSRLLARFSRQATSSSHQGERSAT